MRSLFEITYHLQRKLDSTSREELIVIMLSKGFFITCLMILTLVAGPVANAFSYIGSSPLSMDASVAEHTSADMPGMVMEQKSSMNSSSTHCVDECLAQCTASGSCGVSCSGCSHSCSAAINDLENLNVIQASTYADYNKRYHYLISVSNKRPPRTLSF